MKRLVDPARELAASVPFRVGVLLLIALSCFVASQVRSAIVLPPLVALSADPLYSKGLRAKPTLTLALSVEYPTVGAAYVGAPGATEDATYTTANQYIGYFDSESCYVYNNNADSTLRRFDRSGAATNHGCAGTGFSGNFMNWATSSAVDTLRYALTGGDRVVDTTTLTVLQRAVLPNSSVSNNFWNGSNFPAKRLLSSLVAGAVPSALVGSYSGDVYVANCLNRVHFGTAKAGDCTSPGTNGNLGASSATVNVGPISAYNGVLPLGLTLCASENGTCAFSGIKQVAYGAAGRYYYASAKDGVVCSNAVFGDPYSGVAKSCWYRDDPTGWTPPVTAGALSADTYFYTRVSVCSTDSSGNLTDPRGTFCRKYPGGNYKPIGNLQKHSDDLRVAAFGYLNDPTGDPNQRYGGVLRAAMKYVGAKGFDNNFVQSLLGNPQQEWDPNTGIFLQNPDALTTGLVAVNSGANSNWPNQPMSGVTNYLNQFGRTGTFGQYKTYDPVGELYYEALRYIQGLTPTPAATTGLTDTMKDGYPVYTGWIDPHPPVLGIGTNGYACVKNNILVIGDVNTWNDKSYPGNRRTSNGDVARTANVATNEPDFYYWTQVVGAFEGNTGMSYKDGQGVTRSATNFNTPNTARIGMADQDIGSEGAAYYIAGAAYWANTHDIRGTDWTLSLLQQRPGMRASTYMLDVNEFAGSSNYGTRVNNQFFMAAKYGGFNDATLTGNPFLGIGPGGAFVNSNANWSKPSIDGNPNDIEASNYFLSSSAAAVVTALDNIFASLAKGANSISGAAISTQTLSTANTGYIYQGRFDPVNYWAGDVIPFQIVVSGGSVSLAPESSAPWKAASQLDNRDLIGSPRNIVVGSQSVTPSPTAMNFVWASLDTTTQNLIKIPGDSNTTGAARLDYLRGNRLGEGTTYRLRGSRLGDIVNSGIAYSGAPSSTVTGVGYASFYATNQSRAGTLFVGANDGMLHAFDAQTGNEKFAYIPSWVVPRLDQLSLSGYVHQSFVDATPVVAEAIVGGTTAAPTWKTVLVGGTGGGGQGVYALDVTNPTATAFGPGSVMWEFTDQHDPAMGNVVGKPQILKFRVGDASASGTPVYKYYAVVASGVDNYAADGAASTTGYPALFILDLAKAAGTAWTQGSNYWKIEFPRALSTSAQGMVNFSATAGAAGEVSALYAGDLQGNMWKLDFSVYGVSSIPVWSTSASTAAVDKMSWYKDTNSHAVPMFIATDASGKVQPITMAPSLIAGRGKSVIVAFGTGKYMETADISAPYGTQTIYALYDNNIAGYALDATTVAIGGRAWLNTSTATGGAVTGNPFIFGRPTSSTDTTKRAGWFFDLPVASSGERQVSDFSVIGGTIYAGTVIPAATTCDDGSGNTYIMSAASGGANYTVSDVGLPGPPIVVTLPGSSSNYDSSRSINGYSSTVLLNFGSSGQSQKSGGTPQQRGGRLSWRQLNYNN